jgi:DNA-directed RNA polymerase specialized sigma24 family protein
MGTVMSRLSRARKLLAQVLVHANQETSWTANK